MDGWVDALIRHRDVIACKEKERLSRFNLSYNSKMPEMIQAFFVNCSRVVAREVNGCAAEFFVPKI
jgi:hypothetical protein